MNDVTDDPQVQAGCIANHLSQAVEQIQHALKKLPGPIRAEGEWIEESITKLVQLLPIMRNRPDGMFLNVYQTQSDSPGSGVHVMAFEKPIDAIEDVAETLPRHGYLFTVQITQGKAGMLATPLALEPAARAYNAENKEALEDHLRLMRRVPGA